MLECVDSDWQLSIFNRWGALMFETERPDGHFWDGVNFDGTQARAGVYYYLLRDPDGDAVHKGHITLLR